MAIAEVAQTTLSANGFSTSPKTLTAITPSAGDLLVATITSNNTQIVTVITDNNGNTWVQIPSAQIVSGGGATDIWYVQNCNSGSTTISVTCSGFCNLEFIVTEFSGASITAALVTGSGTTLDTGGPPNPPIGPNLTPARTGEVLITVCAGRDVNLTGVDAPWVGLANTLVTGGCTAYLTSPALSTTHAVFEPTGNQNWLSSGAIFQPPVTGASSKKKASMNLVFE